jgi:hypothetical protein
MNLSTLNELLKAHGMSAERLADGNVVLTEEALEALSDCRKLPERYFVIQAVHTVEVTYRVPETTFKEALDQLCDVELFREHGDNLFGPHEGTLESLGIEVVDSECYTDPAPTGHQWTQRDWKYHVEDAHGEEVEGE